MAILRRILTELANACYSSTPDYETVFSSVTGWEVQAQRGGGAEHVLARIRPGKPGQYTSGDQDEAGIFAEILKEAIEESLSGASGPEEPCEGDPFASYHAGAEELPAFIFRISTYTTHSEKCYEVGLTSSGAEQKTYRAASVSLYEPDTVFLPNPLERAHKIMTLFCKKLDRYRQAKLSAQQQRKPYDCAPRGL